MLELKFYNCQLVLFYEYRFNRTMLELKFLADSYSTEATGALIVPCWN